ncbi:MAG: polysaccharide pyruvyl transferase family protein [Candidatus Erginobacter occultus]|nr:polysaccharide pyruvyl transferase family protein [Candidatus Erginobacter occultus]
MKILLLNTHSTLNSGDTGIVLAQVKLLRGCWPGARISLTSRTPDIDRPFYEPLGISVLDPIIPAPGVFLGAMRKCGGSLKNLINLQGKLNLLSAIRESNLVISSGGGYLYSYGRDFPGPTFLQHFLHLKLAQAYNKPVIFFPQSFGPFANRAAARMCGSILRGRNILKIFAREHISRSLLLDLMGNDGGGKVALCPDAAFLLEPGEDRRARDFISSLHRPILALTLRDWHFPEAASVSDKIIAREKYLSSMLEVSSSFLRRFGGTVVVVPQVRGPDLLENDLHISREFVRRSGEMALGDRILLPLAEAFDSPQDIIALLSRADLVLATRFHSVVFALLAKTPVVAVGYHHKASGILEELGLERFLVDISDISPDKILPLLVELMENRARWRDKIAGMVGSARKMIYFRLGNTLKEFQLR